MKYFIAVLVVFALHLDFSNSECTGKFQTVNQDLNKLCKKLPKGLKLPHPTDGVSYMTCENGVAVPKPCGQYVVFDLITADCSKGSSNPYYVKAEKICKGLTRDQLNVPIPYKGLDSQLSSDTIKFFAICSNNGVQPDVGICLGTNGEKCYFDGNSCVAF